MGGNLMFYQFNKKNQFQYDIQRPYQRAVFIYLEAVFCV